MDGASTFETEGSLLRCQLREHLRCLALPACFTSPATSFAAPAASSTLDAWSLYRCESLPPTPSLLPLSPLSLIRRRFEILVGRVHSQVGGALSQDFYSTSAYLRLQTLLVLTTTPLEYLPPISCSLAIRGVSEDMELVIGETLRLPSHTVVATIDRTPLSVSSLRTLLDRVRKL